MNLKEQVSRASSLIVYWFFVGAIMTLVVYGFLAKTTVLNALGKSIVAVTTFFVWLVVAVYFYVRFRILYKWIWGYKEKPETVTLIIHQTHMGDLVWGVECSHEPIRHFLSVLDIDEADKKLKREDWTCASSSELEDGDTEYIYTKKWEE